MFFFSLPLSFQLRLDKVKVTRPQLNFVLKRMEEEQHVMLSDGVVFLAA